jgi:hypothetical protein
MLGSVLLRNTVSINFLSTIFEVSEVPAALCFSSVYLCLKMGTCILEARSVNMRQHCAWRSPKCPPPAPPPLQLFLMKAIIHTHTYTHTHTHTGAQHIYIQRPSCTTFLTQQRLHPHNHNHPHTHTRMTSSDTSSTEMSPPAFEQSTVTSSHLTCHSPTPPTPTVPPLPPPSLPPARG